MNLFNLTPLHFGDIVFLDPFFLYLGVMTCLLPSILLRLSEKKEAITIGFGKDLIESGYVYSLPAIIKKILFTLAYLCFFLLFANPHTSNVKEKISKEGIDIVLALDISSSMEANDLKPNRIEAAKDVIRSFTREISSDRLGIVIFAGKPYASVPLTYDYKLIQEVIKSITTQSLSEKSGAFNGTAIGDALLLSEQILISQEEDVSEREKIVILLSDGEATTGLDPILASISLSDKNIKIYTIGIGSEKGGNITFSRGPIQQNINVPPLDDTTLKEIAQRSNAKFYRASDTSALENIFSEIALLEKTEIETEVEKIYSSEYQFFLVLLLISLFGIFVFQGLYKN